ncbi:COMM domain-containing protein 8-like [Uloborus diversus]|uniref:COMM domain-containing protein 8-like n=1 Tax=Uloborus diversus TaxID=327109 RepID=UPI0024095421|nr:COMM domain-containing protein 8-like [Uloborus diversus]
MELMDQKAIAAYCQLLIKCPNDRFQKLFHHIIDVFCGCQNVIYENYSDVWTLVEWWDLIAGCEKFLTGIQGMEEKLPTVLEPFSPEIQSIMKDSLEVRRADLKSTLLEKSHKVCPAYLVHFDWKVKLTLASDKMAQINEPRLLLDLDITGNKEKTLQLDLSKEETKMLIESMEKAKLTVLDYLTNE